MPWTCLSSLPGRTIAKSSSMVVTVASQSEGAKPWKSPNGSMNEREYDEEDEDGIDAVALRTKSLATLLKLARHESQTDGSERSTSYQQARIHKLLGNDGPPVTWTDYLVEGDELKGKKRKVWAFYERQNRLIKRYSRVDRLLSSNLPQSLIRTYLPGHEQRRRTPSNLREIDALSDSEREDGDGGQGNGEREPLKSTSKSEQVERAVHRAIVVNFIANVILLILKVFVAVSTNSLSIVASLVDSVLDFLSSVIIWMTTSFIARKSWKMDYEYPVGRNRMEPIGVVIFGVIMTVAFCQVALEALQRLAGSNLAVVHLGLASILIMVSTVVVKGGCWLYCRLTFQTSSVKALGQDAMTDVIFNSASIAFPVLGLALQEGWLDPLGAVLLSFYIIKTWSDTSLEHIRHLCGAAASVEDRQVILYMCMRFATSIRHVSAVKAYHAGDRLHVEVDVMMADSNSLRDAHDVGEALQYAIETLPFVERAFVHLEYDFNNPSGHLGN